MKALMYLGIKDMKIVETDKPKGGVIVRVSGSGICGTDLKTYLKGHHFFKPPAVLGHEFYGVVEEVPEGVESLKAGDYVAVAPYFECGSCEKCVRGAGELCSSKEGLDSGSFCEYISFPAGYVEKGVFKVAKPDDVYTIVEPLAYVINGISKLNIKDTSSILIVGAGPMGALFALAFLKKGMQIGMAEVSEKRRSIVEKWGINTISPEGVEKNRYDQIIIAVNKGELLKQYASMACGGGNVLLFSGLPRSEFVEVDPYDIHYREVCIIRFNILLDNI
jgi:L-iditol 2-dehydrogenase